MIHLFGMAQLAREFEEAGMIMMIITLILGNVTFFMLDVLLGKRVRRRTHG